MSDSNILASYLSGDLNEDAKQLLANFFAADDEARGCMLLTSDGLAKKNPNKNTLLRLLPVTWRPTILRFFVFR